MIRKLLFAMMVALTGALAASAQIVTTSPSPLQADSKDVTIYFHADQGNKGLMGLAPNELVYAHTGVILSTAKNDSEWSFAPTWGDNSQKYQLTYVSPNLYSLYIGDIYTYYGISDPTAEVKKLAFVFRNSTGSKEGKTASGGDIFVDVMDGGFQLVITSSLGGETVLTPDNSTVHFQLGSTETANLSLSVNGTTIKTAANATLLEADYTFPGQGNYTVTGEATLANGTKETTELKLIYPKSSPQANYPGGVPKMGAVANADGSVTFCLAAPNKKNVILVGSWTDFAVSDDYVMSYQDYNGFRYFWITVPNVEPDKMYMYYYLVDSKIRVADPYAKLVLDPSNDKYIPEDVYPGLPKYPTDKVPATNVCLAIYQGTLNDYNWTDDKFVAPAKSDLIIYELLLRDFTGTEGQAKGDGTVKLALQKLPYLKSLGVNVIELLPINEFNGNISWGYNPNFYFAPDKAYGTPDDYKEFINACHENGMAVVLDMVFNQSDWQHPWYQMYDRGSNPFYNATAPHAYSVLNDWNQGYGLVRQQWKDVVQYWINEYHIDGYRFDLVKGLGNNDSYPNNGDSGTNQYNQSRVDNMRQIQQWVQEVNPNAYFINENLAGAQEENAMAAFGQLNWANINDAACQFAMGYESNSSLNRLLATFDSRTWGSTISYLESHDEQRMAYKQDQWGVSGVKGDLNMSMRRLGSAAAQMIMAPGSHMIWQFGELGNGQNTKDNTGGNNTDPKVVHWNYLNDPARRGLYDSYSELIKVRLHNPELFAQNAGYQLNYSQWSSCRTFRSNVGGKELILVVNPQVSRELSANISFASTNQSDYSIASKSYGTTPSFNVAAGNVTVPAGGYVLIINKNVDTSVDTIVADGNGAYPVDEEWYTLTGARVSNPSEGIYIKVVKYSDGAVRSYKVVK